MSGSFPRVVVTGMGVVSPLGVGIRTHWQRLLDGYCGIVKLSDTAYDPVPCKIAARVPSNELDLSSYRQTS
ncbi:unnamed protein product [Didymodactylos carnosus]|uniref:beta-ketoacyl-[acyl-carrier-protein] synthase I n=1 Tax=Didymodactylos carnosus TaxID=1234261 RepID=A0A813U4D2_9BILA|nr:unnamed protein product [Didymodactylos carnosus]CAF3604554.1 unnamed protein product [Didymodactylos carnosus]